MEKENTRLQNVRADGKKKCNTDNNWLAKINKSINLNKT